LDHACFALYWSNLIEEEVGMNESVEEILLEDDAACGAEKM